MKEEEESEKETKSEREIGDNGKGYFKNIWKNSKCFFKETPPKCLSKKILSSVFLNFKSIFKNIVKHLFYTLKTFVSVFKVRKHFKKTTDF